MKEKKHCIDCGRLGVHERHRCVECAKQYNRDRAKQRYSEIGRHNYGEGQCNICKKSMTLWRKDQQCHQACRKKIYDDYSKEVCRDTTVMTIGRRTIIDLGIVIPKGYVVHHLDENPLNNDTKNLVLLSRNAHCSLHRYLQQNWSLWLKNHNSNPENCWDTLRDHLTKTWLEIASVRVIKINDIGQSAAEPYENEEGSETMYWISETDNAVGKDIVQTQT